jgi:sugar diacid utilization regulator
MRQRFGESLALHGLSKAPRPESVEAGISASASSAGALPDLYEDALAALQAVVVDSRFVGEADYGAIGIYQQFSRTNSGGRAHSSNLDAVLKMPNGEQMLAMLERVYDFNGPRTELAAELHIHRTSLYHRLRRIGEALGRDPLDSFVKLDLHAAIKARRWLARPAFTSGDDS